MQGWVVEDRDDTVRIALCLFLTRRGGTLL